MRKKFEFDGKITFRNVIDIYDKIIHVGVPFFNEYLIEAFSINHGLSSWEKRVSIHRKDEDPQGQVWLSASDEEEDRLVSIYSLDDIAEMEVSHMYASKPSAILPFHSYSSYSTWPFVKNRFVIFKKNQINAPYKIELQTDTRRDMKKVEGLFRAIVSAEPHSVLMNHSVAVELRDTITNKLK